MALLWAVLAAAVTNIALGMVWYGFLFAKPWMKSMGISAHTKEEQQKMQKEAMPGYAVSLLSAALATILLWFLYSWADGMPEAYAPWLKGLVLGFTVWLGFYVGPTLTATFFEGRRWGTWMIGAGYWGILSMLYGVYVGLFQ